VVPPETPTRYDVEPPTREHASLLAVLRRRAWIVIGVTILAAAAAAAFAFATRDTYESTAKLTFLQTISPELNVVGLLPTSLDADNLAQNNVDLVASRRVAVATAQELQSRGVDMSADDVQGDVAVSSEKDSDVVDVVATASSASRAALLANVYSETAADLAERDQKAQARRALASLERQFAELPREEREALVGPASRIRSNIEQMRVLADVGNGSPQIIQRGYVPTSKSGNPLQTILLGALFGLVLGVGLALLREQADGRLHRTEQVSAAFDAPVLTTVPRNRALKRHVPFGDLPPEVAEAFRMLQMHLRYSESEPVRSILVTSSRSREGKTTVAWNLASAATSSGLAVALVEADMRRPSLAERYGLAPEPGLTEVLSGETPIAEALQAVLPLSGEAKGNGYSRRLDVLVAGKTPPDPWALMQSPNMAQLLDVLKQHHDLVVLDTPPIPHVADAISLLRRVDGVLVTASVNSTRGPEARRLRDQLQTLDARILGVVANGGSAAAGYAYTTTSPSAAAGTGQANGRHEAPTRVT
jgi:succinoglycan biosynthesis transport protein ExoP